MFSAPGEDSENEADGTDETEERQAEDEDSTSGEQLFGVTQYSRSSVQSHEALVSKLEREGTLANNERNLKR
ncbi:MAG: hypothetical protein M3297_11330 [Thermoproteota archaeon]|nr:hypothetical protein [Thermoproteota archaeon]